MHRIDGLDHVGNLFSDVTPATVVTDDWLNAVQEELALLLEGMGVTLVKGTNNQLLAACVAAATANRIVRRDASGRAQFASPSVAADAATKGYVDNPAPPTWTLLTPGTGWTNGSGAEAIAYHKDRGVVRLRGNVLATASAVNPIATLPVGCRPLGARGFYGRDLSSAGHTIVFADGTVVAGSLATGPAIYLDGVSFLAEQ